MTPRVRKPVQRSRVKFKDGTEVPSGIRPPLLAEKRTPVRTTVGRTRVFKHDGRWYAESGDTTTEHDTFADACTAADERKTPLI